MPGKKPGTVSQRGVTLVIAGGGHKY